MSDRARIAAFHIYRRTTVDSMMASIALRGSLGRAVLAAVLALASIGCVGVAPSGEEPSAVPKPTRSPTAGATGTPPARSSPEPRVSLSPETTASPSPTPDVVLAPGDEGGAVRSLQRRLTGLGFWLGPDDGTYGVLTEQAVMAFQKAAGLERTGTADARTQEELADAGRPRPRSTSGDLVEVDKTRQLLLVVRDGRTLWTFNTSTGTNKPYRHPRGYTATADTPSGRWTIDWQVDGRRHGSLGPLWRPKYFHRDGLAIHGYGNVPAYAASHGCVRVRFDAMDFIWREHLAPLQSTVWVYGHV